MAKLILVDVFDIPSIIRAAKEVEDYAKWMEKKSDELCKRLAELGRDVAVTAYASGEADGNDDVDVTVEKVGNANYIIRASGSQTYFIEFGAGVTAGEGYDTSVIEPPVDITPKSWSATKGTGEYANSKEGYWHYKGERYKQVVPRKGMYLAVKEIESRMREIAKEVLND